MEDWIIYFTSAIELKGGKPWIQSTCVAQSAGAVEYTDCFSAEG